MNVIKTKLLRSYAKLWIVKYSFTYTTCKRTWKRIFLLFLFDVEVFNVCEVLELSRVFYLIKNQVPQQFKFA